LKVFSLARGKRIEEVFMCRLQFFKIKRLPSVYPAHFNLNFNIKIFVIFLIFSHSHVLAAGLASV
jgi:hypothetical protein